MQGADESPRLKSKKLLSQHTQYNADDSGNRFSHYLSLNILDFLKSYSHLLYRTTAQNIGAGKTLSILIISI